MTQTESGKAQDRNHYPQTGVIKYSYHFFYGWLAIVIQDTQCEFKSRTVIEI